jgi:radical SAM superfamily enzyme YgiQ (UPF0313 family)
MSMHYVEPVIRPPSEADSILLQVTTGCSYNKCAFCGVYKGKPFSIVADETIAEDLAWAGRHCRDQNRLFLVDGDALIMPCERMAALLAQIKQALPWVNRVGTYANAKAISRRSDAELAQLRGLGLKQIHMGLESGDDETLKAVCKYGDSAFIVEQGKRVRAAGMKLFVTVLLGLGGVERSQTHAAATGRALSAMDPSYVGALSLMLMENTPLYRQSLAGEFHLPSPLQMLAELRTMIANTDVSLCLFFANHASNYVPIEARLPREKEQVLRLLDAAAEGKVALRPEWMRGL